MRWSITVAAFAFAVPAHAQISWQPNFNLAPAMMQAVVLNPCAGGECDDDKKPRPPVKAAPKNGPRFLGPPIKRPATAASLGFVPNLALRQKHYAKFIAEVSANSQKDGEELRRELSKNDVIATFGKSIQPFGIRIDNVTDAFALYWISASDAAQGNGGLTEPRQATAVKRQVLSVLGGLDMLTSASPAKKQEFAEALIVQSLFLLLANGNAGSDPQRRAALAQGARKGALAMGLDLDAFRLTPTGFVAAE